LTAANVRASLSRPAGPAEWEKRDMHKTAVITGGASGLGEACARRFAADGAMVWLLDRNAEGAKRVAASIRAAGGQAEARRVDVSDEAALEALAAEILAPDFLLTAAGIIETVSTILDADMAAHDRLWEINYRGTLLACRAFGRAMRERGGGTIVTFGSVNSYAALPLPAYCPSKTAILRLTQMLAVELGRHGIRVNGVAPTYVLTPGLQAKVDAGERDLDTIRAASALGQVVTPENVANVVAFLCSDAAAAVTGHMMPVDAGYISVATYTGFAGGVPWEG
jgi:NAD(P)-dependent dehydrogenase (short-subunit alcohol dehydrogenase family)